MLNALPAPVEQPPGFLSMDGIPPARRYAFYRETMATKQPPIVTMTLIVDRDRDNEETAFNAGFQNYQAGELRFSEQRGDPLNFTRSKREIAVAPAQDYHLFLQLAGVWHFEQGGRETIVEPGGMLLVDSNEPFRSIKRHRWHHRAIRIPRAQADAVLAPDWHKGGLAGRNDTGLGRVAARFARGITDEIAGLSQTDGAESLHHLIELYSLSTGIQPGKDTGARAAIQAGRLAKAKRHIKHHLTDPGLTPSTVAAAIGVSLRGLHSLFEPSGESLGEHVLRHRLNMCRTLLANPAMAERSITDIAFASGFNSLPTFYRCFQRRFGAAPGDFRRPSAA